ncbi:hypothetical protein QTP70_004994, partial [Hemibagrus guttatus]
MNPLILSGLADPTHRLIQLNCVLTQDRGWSVEYPDKLICAVRGFSVSIPCSYSYPQNHQFVWSKNNQRLNTSGPVLHFPALTVRDSGKYTCTWKTGETSGSETISLHVEDEDPERWLIWVIVLVIVGVSVFVSVAVIHNRRRKVKAPEENVGESGEKTRTKPQFSSQVSHVADEEMLNKEEVTYSSVQKKAATKGSQLNRDPQPDEEDEEDEGGVVYAPVWIKPNKATKQISRRNQGLEGVRFWDHRISSLIFADDVVLLASSGLDLQHALGRFAAECEAAGMRVSTSKSEAMVLDRKKVACTLQVGGEVLPQVEEFKYLGVLFTSEGRMDREIDRRIGAAAAVMRSMYRSVVVKKELSRKAKLSIYQSIYVPQSTLTYGHELWVMTER